MERGSAVRRRENPVGLGAIRRVGWPRESTRASVCLSWEGEIRGMGVRRDEISGDKKGRRCAAGAGMEMLRFGGLR